MIRPACYVCTLPIRPEDRLRARKSLLGAVSGVPVRLRHHRCPGFVVTK